MMEVRSYSDPQDFIDHAWPLLLADEARHNLMLGVVGTLVRDPGRYRGFFLWMVEDHGGPVAVAARTPPFNLLVSRPARTEAIGALVEQLSDQGVEIPGVVAAVPEVEEFALRWSARTGAAAVSRMAQGIYRLDAVRLPEATPGEMRLATEEDRPTLIRWLDEFDREAIGDGPRIPWAETVDRRLRRQDEGFGLWEVGGRVASLAGFGSPTPHGIRIGPVYTPPKERRQGFGRAVTAAVSALALARGFEFCFLYTDLSNPTSNQIYRDIGYELVCESRDVRFDLGSG
jgi:uncharacterized protein